MSFGYACSNTGINYARHSYVKSVQSDDKDEMYKCYMCLFTCATTRNDHLELSSSMNCNTNDETNFLHKLLLSYALFKAFAINFSAISNY